jgi:hypothetical protein
MAKREEQPKRKQRQTKQRFASAHEQYQNIALDEARRVPWPQLTRFVEESLRWEEFSLWIRAVVNAANGVPPVVEQELEIRIPGFLARVREELDSADEVGERAWNLVGAWIHTHVLLQPKVEGWLNAVNFYSSRTMTYMKFWEHWERMTREWRTNPPAEWPSYERWQNDVAAVTQMRNPDGEPQRILDAMLSVPGAEWERMLSAYSDIVVFGVWMELLLDLEGPQSPVVARALAAQYPGFAFSSGDLPSTAAVRELLAWVIVNVVRPPSEEVMGAIGWHIKRHPEYYAIREYAIKCHNRWASEDPTHPPSFREWRRKADQYCGVATLS